MTHFKYTRFRIAFLGLVAILLVASGVLDFTPLAAAAKTAENIVYANSQSLALYVPQKSVRRTAIIFVHGGGFTSGSRHDLSGHAKLFADGGFVTASVDYRLAPEHPAPAAQDDVIAAVRWIVDGGGGRGLAINRVILVGYSAGATISMMTALKHKSEIAAVVALAGVSDLAALRAATPHAKLKSDIDAYVGAMGADAVSPIAQDLSNAPPLFLIHGKKDALVPISQSLALATKLKAAGNKMLFKVVPKVGHEVFLPNRALAEILRDISKYAVAVDAQ